MFLSNNRDLSGFVLKSRSDEAPVRRRSLVERTGMKNLMQVTICLLVVDDHLLDDDQHLHGVGVGDHVSIIKKGHIWLLSFSPLFSSTPPLSAVEQNFRSHHTKPEIWNPAEASPNQQICPVAV